MINQTCIILVMLVAEYVRLSFSTNAPSLHESFRTVCVPGVKFRGRLYTVRRKMFAINNFREFREWSTFANIIIRELYVAHTRPVYIYIYLCMHYTLYHRYYDYNYGDVALRWRTSMVAICLVKPCSGRSSMES